MKANPELAAELLHEIEQAKILASRHSENNGILQITWGIALVIGLAGFDVFPRFYLMLWGRNLASFLGPYTSAIFMLLVAIGTAIWTRYYIAGQPIRPLRLGNFKLLIGWGFYHTCVFAIGTLPFFFDIPLLPFWFTAIGILGAGPLIILGWRMRKQAYTFDW